MSKEYVYGKWSSLGCCWGEAEVDRDGTITHFSPEWYMKSDLTRFWKARKQLIKVMGISGYVKELCRGLRIYWTLV